MGSVRGQVVRVEVAGVEKAKSMWLQTVGYLLGLYCIALSGTCPASALLEVRGYVSAKVRTSFVSRQGTRHARRAQRDTGQWGSVEFSGQPETVIHHLSSNRKGQVTHDTT